jgi:hypothetical protein
MSHHKHHRKKRESCGEPLHFHDSVGKGTLNSTPIIVPPGFDTETGDPSHPGPFVAQAFNPSGQKYYGLFPRRNTPNTSPEKGGKILMDEKHHGDDHFYKPRVKNIHRNFAKKALHRQASSQ